MQKSFTHCLVCAGAGGACVLKLGRGGRRAPISGRGSSWMGCCPSEGGTPDPSLGRISPTFLQQANTSCLLNFPSSLSVSVGSRRCKISSGSGRDWGPVPAWLRQSRGAPGRRESDSALGCDPERPVARQGSGGWCSLQAEGPGVLPHKKEDLPAGLNTLHHFTHISQGTSLGVRV